MQKAHYPLTGASDHCVSEALYLNDSDNNGVELYWDRHKEQWKYKPNGTIEVFTHVLDLDSLMIEIKAT